MGSADRLRLLRRAYRRRSATRSRAEVAYRLYLIAIIGVPVGVVIIRAITLTLSTPAALGALSAPGAPRAVGIASGLALAGLGWLGGVYGPVTLAPHLAPLWAGTDLPRHRALARRFAGATVLALLLCASVSALPSAVMVANGGADVRAAIVFVTGAVVFGIIAAVVWLAGQAIAARRMWLLPTGIAAVTLLGAVAPPVRWLTPWGWVAALWPPGPEHGVWVELTLLGLLAAGSWWLARVLLGRLTLPRLVATGLRWRSATTAATTGDVAGALGQLRAQPSVGRRWRAVRGGPPAAMFLMRDLIGAMRTPARPAVAAISLAASCLALTLATSHQLGWLLAAAWGALAYLALGVFSDGFRHASDTAAAPAVYGLPAKALFVRHSGLPLLVTTTAILLAQLATAALGTAGSASNAVLIVAITIAARAFDSAKGFLPPILLTPIPSPIGDLSALNVIAWQADALLISSLSAAAVTALIAASAAPAAITLGTTTLALLLLGLHQRLSRL